MQRVAIITYFVVACCTFLSVLIFLCHGWNQEGARMERMGFEPPEDMGSGFVAAFIFFMISMGAAILWPLFPILLIGILVYVKFQEKMPGMCGVDEEDPDPGPQNKK